MITVCCPTRGRPESMARLYNSLRNTAYDRTNIELIFYIDDDDDESIKKMHELELSLAQLQINMVIGPRIILADTWNKCMIAGQGPIYMVCADDIVFESKNWDALVEYEFMQCDDKILLVYGKDGGKNERLATHPFLHENWIDTVGYFTPPYFHFCMCDKWLDAVAREINRIRFVPQIVTAHHNCTNKNYTSGVPDNTWDEMQQRGIAQDYRGEYHKRGKEREEIVKKIQEFINNFERQ